MKNPAFLWGMLLLTAFLSLPISCKKQPKETEKPKLIPTSVTDIDENVYPVIRLDDKLWMTENLKVTQYDTQSPCVNDTIFEATDKQGVDCNRPYFKDARNFKESPFTDGLNSVSRSALGLLYNWCAAAGTTGNNTTVSDTVQGICPNGWRLPLPADFEVLCDYFGGKELAGKKLKSSNGWYSYSGTDESGMHCYPAGLAIKNDISLVGQQTMFWSSKSEIGNNAKADILRLFYNLDNAEIKSNNKIQANSVRCILDLDNSYVGF